MLPQLILKSHVPSSALCVRTRPLYAEEIKFENATSTCHLDLCLCKTRAGKSYNYRNVTVYEKLRLQNRQNVFRPHLNAKRQLQIPPA